jgi:biopolymer transport protein TolR
MRAASFARHKKRKLKAEINVVPYIDVMLVLLIIFMVTAPLLNLGVDIDLPKSNAKAITQKKEPIVVVVDKQGNYSLKMQDVPQQRVDATKLTAEVSAFVKMNPEVAVFVAGDQQTSYDAVYQAMVLLQQAGVERVSLMSRAGD